MEEKGRRKRWEEGRGEKIKDEQKDGRTERRRRRGKEDGREKRNVKKD